MKSLITKHFSRRQLLRGSVTATILAPFSSLLLKSKSAFAQMTAFVTEADPVAKALKYVADIAKAKPDPRKDKPGAGGKVVAAKQQVCLNCMQYTSIAPIGGKPAGKCNMIQSGAVTANGWCSVWVHKPGK